MMFNDPRLEVHGVAPSGKPVRVQADFDRNKQEYRIFAVGTKTLGVVALVSVHQEKRVYNEYHAKRHDEILGVTETLEDAAALIVSAAHVA